MKLIGWTELDKQFALVSDWQANGNLKSYVRVLYVGMKDTDARYISGTASGIETQIDCIL